MDGALAAGSAALSGDAGCMEAGIEEEADTTWEGVGLDLKRSAACFLFLGSEELGLGLNRSAACRRTEEVVARVGGMVDAVLSTIGVGGVIVMEGGAITISEEGRGEVELPCWKAGVEWNVEADGLAESLFLLSVYSTVWWAGL
jgi:hypothetical protein